MCRDNRLDARELVAAWCVAAPEQRDKLAERYQLKAAESVAKSMQAKSIKDIAAGHHSENPLQEAVGALDGTSRERHVAVMFFAMILGGALAVGGPRTAPLVGVLEGLFDVSMVVIGWRCESRPTACMFVVFDHVTTRRRYSLRPRRFVATAITAWLLQMIVVYSLAVW